MVPRKKHRATWKPHPCSGSMWRFCGGNLDQHTNRFRLFGWTRIVVFVARVATKPLTLRDEFSSMGTSPFFPPLEEETAWTQKCRLRMICCKRVNFVVKKRAPFWRHPSVGKGGVFKCPMTRPQRAVLTQLDEVFYYPRRSQLVGETFKHSYRIILQYVENLKLSKC